MFFFMLQIHGQRNIFTRKDKTTGILKKYSLYEKVGITGATGSIQFKLVQYLADDTTMRLYFILKRSTIRCLGPESKIIIKLMENTDTLHISGLQHCGSYLENYVELYPEDIKLLKQGEMEGFKIQFKPSDGFFNDGKFEDMFTRINPNYFITTLKCFE